MSAFLSQVHYNLYEKMKYLDHLNINLASLLVKQNKEISTLEDMVLPLGPLESVIDHTQIHAWLQSNIQLLESRLSSLLTFIKEENLTEEAMILFQQEGSLLKNQWNDCLQLFQYLQTYMLDGMPCDRGITIIDKHKDKVIFLSSNNVHSYIHEINFFMKLKLAWIQGVLQGSTFSVTLIDQAMYELRKELTCTIS